MLNTFKELTALIKNKKKILIMAHKGMDLDAIGASLCLYEIIESFDKETYIFLDDETNNSVSKAIWKLEEEKIKINYIHKSDLVKEEQKDSLLIVLDTHKSELLGYPEILDMVIDVVIIDHHIENGDSINNPKIRLINSELSSTAEIMVNYLKYLNKSIHPMVATIMLAGLEIDTNNFNLKTSSDTYEAAAYLVKIGASNLDKLELLKENKEAYLKRQEQIKKSYMITEEIALCELDNNTYKNYDLALISEELLQFDGVKVSFTIGYLDSNIVGISARSIGDYDVEKIMFDLGGGGHKTDAACRFIGKTKEEVKEILLNRIKVIE